MSGRDESLEAPGIEHPVSGDVAATAAEAFRNQRRDGVGFIAAILTRESCV
jgi:hypothetical protein